MSYKTLATASFVVSVIILTLGYVISYPATVGICERNNYDCLFSIPRSTLGHPLLVVGPIFLALSFIALFRPEYAFKRWLKFAAVYVPLGALAVAYLISNRFGGLFGEPTPGFKTLVVAMPFFIVSLVIIFWPVKQEKLQ